MKYLSLVFFLFYFNTFSYSQQIVRGPYMQTPTVNSIIFKWRTDINTETKVWWGNSPTNLIFSQLVSGFTTEHRIKITGLQANTKYYYSVGTPTSTLAGADSSHYFFTTPVSGFEQAIRVWATGDFGKGSQGQIDTKNSFVQFTQNENIDPDIWLWLGDNAYQDGKDSEYQDKVFNFPGFSDIFSWLPFWPTPGNHDYNNIWLNNGILGIPYTLSSISDHQGPYYDIVDVPQYAEQGGFESTNEVFYSYDYGNAHFLSLNSEVYNITNDNVLDLMKNWIHQDLQQNTKDWTVAYWHQPPYSKGSHDSDGIIELPMKTMREEILPILELYNIDLVICGHSHVYERSYLITGHYGTSDTYNTSTMLIDGTNGNRAQGTPYIKNVFDSIQKGTIYTVVGNSGSTSDDGSLNHPIMNVNYGDNIYGSLVIDINKNELRARYLKSDGSILDDYSIVKQNMEIHVSDDLNICQYDSATLNVSSTKGSNHKSYTWNPGNILGQQITISPNSTTDYIVRVIDSISLQVSYDTVTVQVDEIPLNPFITNSNGTLSVEAGYYNYAWYRNGLLVSSGPNHSISPINQGVFTVEITGTSTTCQSSTPDFLYYDIDLQVHSSATEVCYGDSVILYITTSGGSDSTNIYWQNPNSTLLNIYFTPLSTQYIVAQGEDYLTGELEQDSLGLIVYQLPNVSLFLNQNVLSTPFQSNYNYNWYFNNQLVSNENSNELNISENGNYYVEVIDNHNCKNVSKIINFNTTSINNHTSTKDDLILFPNPNFGNFTLRMKDEILAIKVYTELGEKIDLVRNNFNIQLDNISIGNYYIEITTKNNTYRQQFLIK